MKKSLLALALLATASSSAIANNAGSIGKGYTGTTSDFTQSVLNPSLINSYGGNDDFYFGVSVGIGFDGQELVSDFSDSLDLIDEISDGNQSNENIENAKFSIADLNDREAKIETDFEFLIAFPNETLGFALFASQESDIALSSKSNITRSTTDSELVQMIENEAIDATATGLGYSVADLGVILGQGYDIYGQRVNFGTSLKFQRIDIFNYKDKSLSDEPEFEDNLVDSSGFNIDLGMDTAFGEDNQYRVAFVAKNLIGTTVKAEDGSVFELDPTISLGAGYYGSWYNLAVEADVLEHTGFKGYEKEQRLKVGAELDAWGHAKLRAGYMVDVNDSNRDRATLGVRLSPGDLFGIDVAGFVGKNDNVGASLQVSLKL